MKKQLQLFLFVTLFLAFFSSSFAQQQHAWKRNRYEAMFGTGASGFLGELGGKNGVGSNDLNDFDIHAVRPLIHIGYNYKISYNATWKNDFTFAYLTGDDAYTDEPFRNNRNIHFRTPIYEFASTINYFPFAKQKAPGYTLRGYRSRSKRARSKGISFFRRDYNNDRFYLFAGISVFYFNPQAKYPEDGNIEHMRGEWVDLKPLRTEGQGIVPTRDEYSLTQIAIPLGLGVKYKMDNRYSIGLEYGIRITFTDYIDDASFCYVDPQALLDYHGNTDKGQLAVHFANPTNNNLNNPSVTAAGQQRGDPRDKDSYMFGKITLYYSLSGTGRRPTPKYR